MDFASLVKGAGAARGDGATCVQAFLVGSGGGRRKAAIDIEKRQIRVLASSAMLDRHGEILEPSAFRGSIEAYLKNPVVLASHHHRLPDGRSPVVGYCRRVWIDKSGLWAVIEFARTELGQEYWTLYRDEAMRAVSVGFHAIKVEPQFRDGRRVNVIVEAELL